MTALIRFLLVPALIGVLIGLGWVALRPPATTIGTGYADPVNRAIPAVVNIYSTKHLRRPPICELEQFMELCDRLVGDRRAQSSLGSGVVMSPAGYILTNEHVIAGADDILVAFHDGQATRARVVGTDLETDLAVLEVEASGLTTMPIMSVREVRVGDVALAIGNPFGIGQTVSLGIVSAKGRGAVSDSPYDDFIQTDAAINLGNSGGALINAHGALIGINTLIFSSDQNSQGIGFAIPADLAYHVMMEIVETGSVTRGFLGASLAPQPARGTNIGLVVTNVDFGGPAYRAGLLPGDIVLFVAGQPVSDGRTVSRQIANMQPGAEIPLTVQRGADQLELVAVAARRPTE